MTDEATHYWLSYGAGVNSTALAVLLARGEVPGVGDNWTAVFADTGNEKDATYDYLREWAEPYFREIGHPLVTVKPPETVLERWQRLKAIGQRQFRTCTDHAKLRPIRRHIKAHGGGVELVGIDAGEAHRASNPDKRYPLVDLDVDRDDCEAIIRSAGLPVPPKSGCWHCPFMRAAEVVQLAYHQPERFAEIERLEAIATAAHPRADGVPWAQWHGHPASYWRERSTAEEIARIENQERLAGAQGKLFESRFEPPCGCYDG